MGETLPFVPTPELLRPIDPVCDDFESAWQRGERPRVEDYLVRVNVAVQSDLLAELIRCELEWRVRNGETPSVADYAPRFPAVADVVGAWIAETQAALSHPAQQLVDTDHSATCTHVPLERVVAVSPAPARVLGEYDLLTRIGAGGMGEVWRARHRRLDRLVAVKLIHARVAQDVRIAQRFDREMKAVGRLNHPNIVTASDAGEHDGTLYLAMELLDGCDLHQLITQRGPLPPNEALELIRQAAHGLAHAHAAGLVHRDIKPHNLFLTSAGTVKLLDLGLAQVREPGSAVGELTGEGAVIGTPDYMAPEQSQAQALDARSDLYSLGCALYYLLLGRAPFADRPTLVAKLMAHTNDPPDLTGLPPTAAAAREILTRLLAKVPAERPQSAQELIEQIDHVLDRSSQVPTRLVPAVRRPAWRRPILAVVGTVAVVGFALFAFHTGDRPAALTTAPALTPPSAALSVLHLTVHLRAKVGGVDQDRGWIGKDSFDAHLGDGVTVQARLSQPAYCYLIAYRPDGTDDVCFPESDDVRPTLTDSPGYPSTSIGVSYGLDEGQGLAAFALVVSQRPLPPYRDWRAERGLVPWRAERAPQRGVIWEYDGHSLDSYTIEHPTTRGTRGKGQEIVGIGGLGKLITWLKAAPDVATVTAVAFPVWAPK